MPKMMPNTFSKRKKVVNISATPKINTGVGKPNSVVSWVNRLVAKVDCRGSLKFDICLKHPENKPYEIFISNNKYLLYHLNIDSPIHEDQNQHLFAQVTSKFVHQNYLKQNKDPNRILKVNRPLSIGYVI